ncbi:hypothetical protein HMPREF0201_04384 [Cedecea davisae DSM 4568]|uniref:Uncharacterized protein n=1 Tax=Cedecea davisae DSM 4568 TaxID=566551 RepID=S3IZK2_9ENTR|nr:hypothetical protein HMPREF0201_04384 [Cedecea davisae DSM 4568]
MGAFGKQPAIEFLKQRAEAIRVVNQVFLTVPDHGELVAKSIFTARKKPAKETAGVETVEFAHFAPGFQFDNPDFGGVRQQRADFKPGFCLVHSQQGKRIGKVTRN